MARLPGMVESVRGELLFDRLRIGSLSARAQEQYDVGTFYHANGLTPP